MPGCSTLSLSLIHISFEQGVVAIGRAKAWTEKDFSYDITGGVDFMDNVAQQVAEYWQDVDQDTLLAVLKLSLIHISARFREEGGGMANAENLKRGKATQFKSGEDAAENRCV